MQLESLYTHRATMTLPFAPPSLHLHCWLTSAMFLASQRQKHLSKERYNTVRRTSDMFTPLSPFSLLPQATLNQLSTRNTNNLSLLKVSPCKSSFIINLLPPREKGSLCFIFSFTCLAWLSLSSGAHTYICILKALPRFLSEGLKTNEVVPSAPRWRSTCGGCRHCTNIVKSNIYAAGLLTFNSKVTIFYQHHQGTPQGSRTVLLASAQVVDWPALSREFLSGRRLFADWLD